MVKNMCFFLRGHRLKSRGVGYVYFHRLYLLNCWVEGDPLSHKQKDLIHQFDVLA